MFSSITEAAVLEQFSAAVDKIGKRLDSNERDIGRLESYLKFAGPAASGAAVGAFLGRSGADDFYNEFAGTVKALHEYRARGSVPKHMERHLARLQEVNREKVVTFDSVTAATAGYLAPEQWVAVLDAIRDIAGAILPRCTRYLVPAGRTVHVPAEGTRPSASWQLTQGGAMAELTATFGEYELQPKLLGAYYKASAELFDLPDVQFGRIMADSMMRAWVRAMETALLAGVAASTAPGDGLLVKSGTHDLTNLPASLTEAGMATFLAEAVAQYPALVDSGVFVLHPAKYAGLLGDAISNETSHLTYGPRRWAGIEVLLAEATKVSSTYYGLLVDPRDLIVAQSPGYQIDVDRSLGFTSNQVYARLLAHADFDFMATKVCKADHS